MHALPHARRHCHVYALLTSETCFASALLMSQDLQESSGAGGQQHIFPVQNVSKESMISPEASILLSKALQGALYAAMDYLENDADTAEAQTRPDYTADQVREGPSVFLPSCTCYVCQPNSSGKPACAHEPVCMTFAMHSIYNIACMLQVGSAWYTSCHSGTHIQHTNEICLLCCRYIQLVLHAPLLFGADSRTASPLLVVSSSTYAHL